MQNLSALRLYFPNSARTKPTRFWHRLSAPTLGHYLLKAAHRSGIRQALLHNVHAGYLSGQKITHHHIEVISPHHPLCIELIDTEEQLRKFLHEHTEELQHVQAILFQCELPI